MKYMNYNRETGEIIGFYTPEININMPDGVVEISEETWQMLLTGGYKVDTQTGKFIKVSQSI